MGSYQTWKLSPGHWKHRGLLGLTGDQPKQHRGNGTAPSSAQEGQTLPPQHSAPHDGDVLGCPLEASPCRHRAPVGHGKAAEGFGAGKLWAGRVRAASGQVPPAQSSCVLHRSLSGPDPEAGLSPSWGSCFAWPKCDAQAAAGAPLSPAAEGASKDLTLPQSSWGCRWCEGWPWGMLVRLPQPRPRRGSKAPC